jgi:rod shape-determining protein MreD
LKPLWTLLAVLGALLVQSALSLIAPAHARVLDPFLLVVVYCGLSGGETHGMLAGLVAGWVQDVHFGGPLLGLGGLTKTVVGFAVGLAGSRLLIAGPGARTLVLLVASVMESATTQWLAGVFGVSLLVLSPVGVLWRATVNAALGTLLFELIERRLGRSRW